MKKAKDEEVAVEELEVVNENAAPKVAPLDTVFGNGELEVIRAKLNEVISFLNK